MSGCRGRVVVSEWLSLMVHSLEVRWGEWVWCVVMDGIFDALDCPGCREATGGPVPLMITNL